MNAKKAIFLVLMLVAVVGCKKNKEPLAVLPESNDPVFTLIGSVDGQGISFSAGVNGMKMKNGIENRNGVAYHFSEMTDNQLIYRLGVFEGNVNRLEKVIGLKEGDTLHFAEKFNQTLFSMRKSELANAAKIDYIRWYVNNELTATNDLEISEPGKYAVCGEFYFYDSSKVTVCNDILLGFEEEVDYKIAHISGNSGSVKLWLNGDPDNLESVQWYMDNEPVSTEFALTLPVGNVQRVISARIRTKTGAERLKTIAVDGMVDGRFVQDFDNSAASLVQNVWDFGVGLEIYKNGQWFSTFESDNYKSKMIIDKVDLYDVNQDGKPVYKVSCRIDAKMASQTTGQTIFVNLHCVYAFVVEQ